MRASAVIIFALLALLSVASGAANPPESRQLLAQPVEASQHAERSRWHRGGAFLFHTEIHPCHMTNQSCAIVDTEKMTFNLLRVNTTIVETMGFVQLTYDLGEDDEAQEGDFIGVYCVDQDETKERSTDRVASSDFFDHVLLNASAPAANKGSVVVGPLVNMRCAYQFRYLRRVRNLDYHCVGESAHVEMEHGHAEPVQIHLALTGTPGAMRVTWTSGISFHQHIHYGHKPGKLTNHTEATTATYSADDMCSAPARTVAARWFRHPGYIHAGVMTGLQRGKTYYYTVGSKYGLVSRVLSFKYPAIPVSKPQNFFLFGDLGQGVMEELPDGAPAEREYTRVDYRSRLSFTSNATVINRIQQDLDEDDTGSYAAAVHVGGLSYATGRTFIWDQFGALIEPVASRIPYMVAVGNHEYDYLVGGPGHDLSGSAAADANGWHPPQGNYGNDSMGECGVPAAKRFLMPSNGNQLFWYSFKIGLTHHIVLSSEHNCSLHSPMHKWLIHELRNNVNRTETPWLLVHLHRPLYASENYPAEGKAMVLLRECLEHTLMKHHVDLVVSGHYHAYERSCPVYKSECRVDEAYASAPTYLMLGSGGAELDDIDYTDEPTSTGTSWSERRLQEYGYGRLHVHNASHAHFEFVRALDRQVADEVWVVSKHEWAV